MGLYAIKLPDIGEGIAEAEIVEWHVRVGDPVRQDDVVVAVMTDKATVEIPAAVSGTVVWLGGEVGDKLPVGSELLRLEVLREGNLLADAALPPAPQAATSNPPAPRETKRVAQTSDEGSAPTYSHTAANPPTAKTVIAPASGAKPIAAPSVRKRAREAGLDLRAIAGSGPVGRITHDDLDAFLARGRSAGVDDTGKRSTWTKEVKVVGLRRKIAERMSLANAQVPHITIVEEVDMTNLEELREQLNVAHNDTRPKVTLLPFLMRAVVAAVREQPALNAHFNDEAGIIRQYGGVHIGIATQTPNGLMVPVVRHAEANSLWDNATEVARLADAARDSKANRGELTGSTITITSLGALGAIATTPIINLPEVAIVGVNKLSTRPWWDGQEFIPRKMMNLSCSFDHRIVDGYEAAVFVHKLKTLLERPAMLFMEGWPHA